MASRKTPQLNSHDAIGWWITDYKRHAENARALLGELEQAANEVTSALAAAGKKAIRSGDPEFTPELYALWRRRDRLSDSVRIFSAIAVEAFINHYGVVRLGEAQYAPLERLSSIPKLKKLLFVCDSLKVTKDDPIVQALKRIGERRNSLVHPKTQAAIDEQDAAMKKLGPMMPGYAREALADMEFFFEQFAELVPGADHLVPRR